MRKKDRKAYDFDSGTRPVHLHRFTGDTRRSGTAWRGAGAGEGTQGERGLPRWALEFMTGVINNARGERTGTYGVTGAETDGLCFLKRG